ncbi:transposase [Candidatus Poriferisodalis sp.]|uniref:transposase n=1 Tax=Candidatus Poriferisodalis sp. TaxID=3101277 RepID=UPI003B51C164
MRPWGAPLRAGALLPARPQRRSSGPHSAAAGAPSRSPCRSGEGLGAGAEHHSRAVWHRPPSALRGRDRRGAHPCRHLVAGHNLVARVTPSPVPERRCVGAVPSWGAGCPCGALCGPWRSGAVIAPAKASGALYSIRSERAFCERLSYDMLFKWFLGMRIDERAFDPSTFSKNRQRLLDHEICDRFFAAVVHRARLRRYCSSFDREPQRAQGRRRAHPSRRLRGARHRHADAAKSPRTSSAPPATTSCA